MSPEKKRIAKWFTALPVSFVLGVMYVGIDWKSDVDHAIARQSRVAVRQSDSIYVNAEKYAMLEMRVVELQTLYAEYRARVDMMEARTDSVLTENNQMLRELTGG